MYILLKKQKEEIFTEKMKDEYFYWKNEVTGQEEALEKAKTTIFILNEYIKVSKAMLKKCKRPTEKELRKSAGKI